MSAYRPYPKTKPSGVEWLGDVPEGWEHLPGRRIFEQRRDSAHRTDDQLSATQKYGVIPQALFMEMEDQKVVLALSGTGSFKHVEKDDFVISLRSFQGGIEHSAYSGCVSPAYTVLRSKRSLSPRYNAHLLKCPQYIAALQAGTDGIREGKSISYEQFGQITIPIPPLPEQHQIAAFLDRECVKLDALQAKQQRLIELLKEKRQALISHAVTKGLNPTLSAEASAKAGAKLKPSGIEWLGDVPVHWQTGRIKTVSKFTTSGPPGWSERVGETGALFVQSGDLNDRLEIEFASTRRVDVEGNAETSRTRLRDGDVVVCITGAKTGNVAVCDRVPEEAYINQHLCLIRPNLKVASRFVGTVLKSHLGRSYFDVSQYGLKQGLSLEDVLEAPMPLPPLAEQRAIVAHLYEKCGKIDQLKAKAERGIELLKERRSALISAAVTGKIDVSEAGTVLRNGPANEQ